MSGISQANTEQLAGFYVDEGRRAVAHSMNSETFQCTPICFLKEYIPYSSAVKRLHIEECKRELTLKGILKVVDGCFTWTTYKAPSPSDTVMVDSDNSAYVDFASIGRHIWAYAERRKLKCNNFDFEAIPDNQLAPSIRGAKGKMDACIVETAYEGILETNNIVMPVEFMNRGYDLGHAVEIRERVVGDCHEILCKDPRRMFIYALTVEDNMMSVWYFSRTHSVMSDVFDWVNEDMDTFIHLLLSFALATPKELGFDPHIHKPCVQVGEKQQYVYELEAGPIDVANQRITLLYKTIKSLGPEHSDRISGRITRIWLVKQVPTVESDDRVEGTKNMILKDVWLDSDARTEAQNMDDIFAAVDDFVTKGLERHPGPDAMSKFIENEPRFIGFEQAARSRMRYLLTDKNYRDLFLNKLHAWDGETLRIRGPSTRKPSIPIFSRTFFGAIPKLKGTVGLIAKTQRRFLYEDVCIPLCDLPNFGVVMDVLSGAREALSILYCAGWVHRDVSTGNILAVASDNEGKTTYQAKLSDLEFAQPQSCTIDGTDHHMGTPFFMPVEIMARDYLFRDLYCDIYDDDDNDVGNVAARLNLMPNHPFYNSLKLYRAIPSITTFPGTADDGTPPATMAIPLFTDPVIHNYHHDLESLWWILLYLITTFANHEPSRINAANIFRPHANLPPRKYYFLTSPGVLYRSLDPILQSVFRKRMEFLRNQLYTCCIARPLFGQLHIPEAFSAIHGIFAANLDAILRDDIVNWRAIPLASPRKADELTEENIGAGKKRPAESLVADGKRPKLL